MQIIIKKRENKHKSKGFQLKEKNKIQLKIINLKTKRLNKSLNHKKVKPFRIKKKKNNINYYFKLPYNTKIYPVFYISLLKKVADQTPLTDIFTFKPKENNIYKVKKILNKKDNKYLIK